MSAAITFDVTGIAALEAFMARIGDIDTTELMERIGIVGENAVSDNFEDEHDPDGLPWKPSFRAITTGTKTLTEHGGLVDSVESAGTKDQVVVGTNLPYARIHNDGGTIRGNPNLKFNIPGIGYRTVESVVMPKRQFVGWGRDALDGVEAEAIDWLAEVFPEGSA